MQAGTFEERNVTAWAKERLAELLVGLRHSNAGANVLVTELTSAAGEAHIWIMRSKKRCGLVAWHGLLLLCALITPAICSACSFAQCHVSELNTSTAIIWLFGAGLASTLT